MWTIMEDGRWKMEKKSKECLPLYCSARLHDANWFGWAAVSRGTRYCPSLPIEPLGNDLSLAFGTPVSCEIWPDAEQVVIAESEVRNDSTYGARP
jgi:hypothetical protein